MVHGAATGYRAPSDPTDPAPRALRARALGRAGRCCAGRGSSRCVARRARIVGADRPGSYDWDRRTDQLKREVKRIGGPSEQRAEIIAWLDAHAGVEAYVEPKTVVSPLSVVFVDADGEWRRFELAEDRFLKDVARERRIKVMDATRVGYPPRMRRRPPTDA